MSEKYITIFIKSILWEKLKKTVFEKQTGTSLKAGKFSGRKRHEHRHQENFMFIPLDNKPTFAGPFANLSKKIISNDLPGKTDWLQLTSNLF